jgi:hypothetical protein
MGNFFKSLSKELGKNTGKYVSNKIFGDNHATPYKIIKQEERSERRFEREKLREEKNYQKKIEKEENRKIREESRVFREQELEERRLLTANKKRLREEEINAKRSEIEARKIINQDNLGLGNGGVDNNRASNTVAVTDPNMLLYNASRGGGDATAGGASSNANEKKEYKQTNTYRPTGNLVYNEEYFQKLENRLN